MTEPMLQEGESVNQKPQPPVPVPVPLTIDTVASTASTAQPLPAPAVSPPQHPYHRPRVHKDNDVTPMGGFACLAMGCLEPKEKELGKARRTIYGCIVTPYIWGGWLVGLVDTLTVVGYSVFTPAHDHVWIIVILTILYLATLAVLLKAQCVDPGVVPRGTTHPQFPKTPNLVISHVNTMVNGMNVTDKDYVGLVAGGTGELVVWRWCNTCEIHRPPRAAHCTNCGWCVKEYDHHCPVVGCCVAERTYRFFTFLLLLLGTQSAVVFFSSAYFLINHDWSDVGPGLPVFTIISMFASAMVGCLGGCWSCGMASHYVRLACTSLTLREEVRELVKPGKRKPTVSNCLTRLFGKQSDSLLPS